MEQNNTIKPISDGIMSYLSKNVDKDDRKKILQALKEKLEEEKLVAKITSAVDLTEQEKEKLTKFLKTKYSDRIIIQFIKDPQILGGIKIKIQDMLIDQSFSGIITKIADKLLG